MKWLLIKMLKNRIKKAEKIKSLNGPIIEHAYNDMIKNYKYSVIYLESQKN